MASTFLGLDRCERKLLGKFPSFFEMIQKIKCKIKGIPQFFGPMTSPAKMLDSADSFTELGDKSILFGASDSQLCWLKKEKSPQSVAKHMQKFLIKNFLMKKKASEEKWKLITKVGRVQGGFFLEIQKKFDNFAAFGFFQLISESFEHQILFFRVGSEQRLEAKKETGRANNSHFELEFE
jgi:hypothetical protein